MAEKDKEKLEAADAQGQEIALDQDPKQITVEVVDDRPEQDRRPPRKQARVETPDEKDDELASYGDSVQKRIKRLKYDYHEERRAKEAALREREEALTFAKQAAERAARIEKLLDEQRRVSDDSLKKAAESDMARAREILRRAKEAGKEDEEVKAQEEMARVAARLEHYSRTPAEPEKKEEKPEPKRAQAAATPKVDPRAEAWAKDNPWFGSNKRMTGFAYGLHEEIIAEQGVNPERDPDKYYRLLDEGMRKAFPEEFEDDEEENVEREPSRKAPAQRSVVAAASRTSKAAPRTVRLTASQVAVAKRLGLSPEQYALEVEALEKSNG